MDTKSPMSSTDDCKNIEPCMVEHSNLVALPAHEKSKVPRYVCFILIASGFIKSLKFGEPYLTRYMRDFKGLTSNEINNSVYPVWTFSYFAFLLPMSFLAPQLGYLKLIWIEAIMEIVTYAILTWGKGLGLMKLMQVTYGVSTAASFGYFVSITTLFDQSLASKWNSYLRATLLVGHVAASLSAQFLVQTELAMDWLFILSFICLCVAWVMTLFLPHPKIFVASSEANEAKKDFQTRQTRMSLSAFVLFIRQQWSIGWCRLKLCYGHADIALWTFLWSTLYCYLLMSESYGSSLWTFVAERFNLADQYNMKDVNGIMDAVGRSIGAFGSLAIAWIKPTYYVDHMLGLIYLMGASVILFGLCMVALVGSSKVWLVITAWTLCIGLGYSVTTMITGILAMKAPKGHHGFMLGLQLFATMILQTIIQVIFSDTALNPDLPLRYYATAGLTATSLVAFPMLYFIESKRIKSRDMTSTGKNSE